MARTPASHIVLLTGASSGIGEATALALRSTGATVIGAARRVDRMAPLEAKGVDVRPVDVADDASMVALVDGVLADHGRIDVLVNNAGFSVFGAVEDVPMDEARRQLEVNVIGLARLCQLTLPGMRAQGHGRIINVASVAGRVSEPLGAWYHASKYAVEAISDAMRLELRPHGVGVSIIEPGPIRTEFGGIAKDALLEHSGSGAYARQARRLARLHEQLFGERAAGPEVVADAIVHAATSSRPRARYTVPASARAMVAAAGVTPTAVLDRVMGQMAGGR